MKFSFSNLVGVKCRNGSRVKPKTCSGKIKNTRPGNDSENGVNNHWKISLKIGTRADIETKLSNCIKNWFIRNINDLQKT